MSEGADMSLVPPQRLGQLLVKHRTASGLSVAQVAQRSPVLPDPRTVEDLEAGRFRLTDHELEEVVAAYGVELTGLAPHRADLMVDLNGRTLAVGDHQVAFGGPRSKMSDEVLSQYLSLVRALRALPPDAEVVLRQRDMAPLSAALVIPSDEIRVRLRDLMEGRPLELRARARLLAGRPLVPALGILVSVTAVGALIFTTPKSGGATSPRATVTAPTAAPEPTPSGATTPEAVAQLSLDEIRIAALAKIPYPWEQMLPGWSIEVHPAREGYLGLTRVTERRIEVYYRDGQSIDQVAATLAHEIGHVVDVTYNDHGDRVRWLESRGLPADHPWFVDAGETDYSVGAGDFAESFAYWQLGSSNVRSRLGGPPTTSQVNLLAELSLG